MKRRIWSALLALVMALSLLPAAAMAADDGTGTVYVGTEPEGETGTYYATLRDAVSGVTEETPTTIVMKTNETIDMNESSIIIESGKNITIDLNGYAVVGTAGDSKSTKLIENRGTLVIKDSTDTKRDGTGSGYLLAGADPAWKWDEADYTFAYSYASNVINNYGTLTVHSGLIKNIAKGSAVYCIDNYENGHVYITGGKVQQLSNSAVRMACFTGSDNFVEISGGIIFGYRPIWIQNYDSTCTATLNIKGGWIKGAAYSGKDYIYSGANSGSKSKVNVNITGGRIDCGLFFYYETDTISVSGNPVFDVSKFDVFGKEYYYHIYWYFGGNDVTGGTFDFRSPNYNSTGAPAAKAYEYEGKLYNVTESGRGSLKTGANQDWQTVDEWREHGYAVAGPFPTECGNYYRFYKPYTLEDGNEIAEYNRTQIKQTIADGYMLRDNKDNTYTVVPIPIPDASDGSYTVEAKTASTAANTVTIGSGVDNESAAEVAKNITVDLNAAANVSTESEEKEAIRALWTAKQVKVDDDNKVVAYNDDTSGDVKITLIKEPYLDVEVTKLDVSETSKKLTMDITPKYNLKAQATVNGTAGEEVTVSTDNPLTVNEATEVSVVLPENFATEANQTVYIKHDKNDTSYYYRGTVGADKKTLTFTSEHGFSPFTFSHTNGAVAEVTTNGTTIGYASLQEAVNAAGNDAIVTVLGNNQTATMSGSSRTITIKNGTNGAITVTINGEKRTLAKGASEGFTYVKPSGSYTTTYSLTVEDSANGSVTASSRSAAKGSTVTLTVKPDEGYLLKSLVAFDEDGAEMALTDKGDGKYTFTMPGGKVTVSAVFAKDFGYERGYVVCPKNATCPIEPFADAVNTAWYHDGVHFCIENDLMQGVSADSFLPNGDVTRAQVVTILWRLEGKPAANYAMQFADVAAGDWYAEAVRWAASNGIVTGYSDTAFGPNDPITREQFAAILYRYSQFKGYDVSVGEDTNIMDYDDVRSISSYAVPAIQWAGGSGLMSGVSTLTLDPTGVTSRAQAATMFVRYCAEIVK